MNIDSRHKMMVLAAAAMAASAVSAMPTKTDFAKAQPIVNELMGPLVNGFRTKKTTASEVGAKAVEYAREAETEAAKFLLLKGAITYYSRAEEYDKAADAVDELDRVVKDIPPDTMLDIISRATSRISEANAPRLHAQYRLVSTRAQAEKEVAKMKALAAKRPADDVVRRRYAEALAASGNWTAALDEFAKVKGKPGQIAAAEKSGKGVSGDIASFWWDYEPEEQYSAEAIKRHAVEFYKKALADGSISGLKKTLAEKRVASLGPVVESGAASAAAAPASEPAKPAVAESKLEPQRTEVASKPAPSAPVVAKGGVWTLPKTFQTPLERSLDLGGGVTMPFCACPAGSFKMLDHKVTITRPYWITKTQVLLPQFLAVPNWKSYLWAQNANSGVAEEVVSRFKDSFVGILITRSSAAAYINELGMRYRNVLPPGYVFRLPTEAEFFNAYNAGANDIDAWLGGVDHPTQTTGEAFSKQGWIPKADKWDWKSIPGKYWMRICEMPKGNAFGVRTHHSDDYGFWLLDKINYPLKEWGKILGRDGINDIMKYADEEIDPLRQGNCWYDAGGGNIHNCRRITRFSSSFFFIVIGPDLEAEKAAAKK